ncbi:hypothetical protein FGB62_292g09 [Gracilaria domingensis]|nr:hypothetical protein FGB62_292g09 [Gracilaria domingensis]
MEFIRRLVVKDPKTYAWGRFEDVRTFVFRRALAMYRAARTRSEFLEIVDGSLIPVSKFVFGQAVNLSVLPRRAVREKSIQRSANMVRNRLRSLLGIQTPTVSKNKPILESFVFDLDGVSGAPGVRSSKRVAAKSSTNYAAGKSGLWKRLKSKGSSVDFLEEREKETESDEEMWPSQPPQEDENACVDDEEMEEGEARTRLGFNDKNPEELPEEQGLLEKGEPYEGGEYPAWFNLTEAMAGSESHGWGTSV